MPETEKDPKKEQEVKNYFVTFVHPDDDCTFAEPASKHNTEVRGLRGTSEDDIKGYVDTHEEACPNCLACSKKYVFQSVTTKFPATAGNSWQYPLQ